VPQASNGLIIDDLEVALSRLSTLGQEILRPHITQIQAAAYRFIERHAWQVVRYASFARWVEEQTHPSNKHWLVLDPLFVAGANSGQFVRVRTSRQRDLSIPPIRLTEDSILLLRDAGAGIIDDAASSGRTIESALKTLSLIGVTVSTVLVCASSRAAQERVRRLAPNVRWSPFVMGDWEVIHLRDGFPLLPFSGRHGDQAQVEIGKSDPLQVRISSAHAHANPWGILQRDREIASTIQNAALAIVDGLAAFLGRPPRVADLRFFGSEANVFVKPGAPFVAEDPALARLL